MKQAGGAWGSEPENTVKLLDRVLGERFACPEDVSAELLPEGVTLRRGHWIPAVGGWLGRMRGPAAAVTLRRTIIVHPEVKLTRRLLAHELEHVRQWKDPLFPFRYTLESLRRGYWNNRYEQQAREAEVSPRPFPLA